MRKITLAIAALAVIGFASPVVSAANAQTIVVKRDNDHEHHYRRHHHKVIVIKHRRHRDHDHD